MAQDGDGQLREKERRDGDERAEPAGRG